MPAEFDFNNDDTDTYEELDSLIARVGTTTLKSFVPKPESVDYEKTYIPRYFIAKAWSPDNMVEVSVDTYNNDFPKLNPGAYNKIQLNWYISGNIKSYIKDGGMMEGVLIKNTRAIDEAKKTLPAIILLKQNLLKFYKSENLYTSGGEYSLTQGMPDPSYIGFYHIAAGIGPMVGPNHTGAPHATLYPVDGSNPVTLGNLMTGTL